MIRQLTEKDNNKLMLYLKKEKAYNLFIIGDIESYGYNSEFQTIWGELDSAGNYLSVLLKYYDYYISYTDGKSLPSKYIETIKSNPNHSVISGKKEMIDLLYPHFKQMKKREFYFTELKDLQYFTDDYNDVQKMNITNSKEIVELRNSIDEFHTTKTSIEHVKNSLINNAVRIFAIEKNDKLVASAATNTECSEAAMIGGVCTHKDHRGLGLATKCMTKLCAELISEEKTPCLFYDNPKAGNIYRKMGFTDIGKWEMLIKI